MVNRRKLKEDVNEVNKDEEVINEEKELLDEISENEDVDFMKEYKDLSIDNLIMDGYVTHKIKIKDKLEIMIRTLTKQEELEVKKSIANYDGVQMYVLDMINLETLSFAVMSINDQIVPDDREEVKKSLGNMADILLSIIIEEYRDLTKALIILLKGSSKNSLARHLLGQN